MPDINGKKLADEAVRRRPGPEGTVHDRIYTPNTVVHGGVLDPGVSFISKPFTLDQLAAKVARGAGRLKRLSQPGIWKPASRVPRRDQAT